MFSNHKIRVYLGAIAAIAFILTGVTSTPLAAQVSTATISGTVIDTSGAAVGDATVQVKNTGTGVVQSTASDAQGRFTVPSLNVGDYEVQATKAGFQSVVRKGITLTVGASAVVDFSLPVGQAQQTVTVEGQVSQVETTNAAVANLVEPTQMRELPLNGRNFQQLILLSPGVSVAQQSQQAFYGKGDTYSIAGGRPEGQAFLLDGTDISNFFTHGTGGGVLGTSLGIDAIGEFQTLTNTYSAQFGGNGSVINAVSKSGTNGFHGSMFEFLRNNKLDTRNYFDKTSEAPAFRQNQYGATIGGPVKKDKAFFFFNYEGLRLAKTYSNVANVPDANGRKGIVGGQQLVLSPVTAPFLALYPATTAVNPNGSGIITVGVPSTQVGDENYYLARYDHNLSEKDAFFGRFVLDKATLDNPFPNSSVPLWPDREPTRNIYATLEERHIFSPTVINVLRGSFVRTENSSRTQQSAGPLLQFTPGLGRQDGQLNVTGLVALGAQALEPYDVIQNKFAESDDVYWTKGAHALKFGFQVVRQQTYEYQPFIAPGRYTYNSLTEFLTNISNVQGTKVTGPFQYQGAPPGGDNAARAWRELFLTPYVNDDWKVNARLTLNLGFRYDFDTNPSDVFGNTMNIVCPPQSCTGTISTGFTNTPTVFKENPSLRNWAPRFGFAFDPFKDHKTSIRGGYGHFVSVIQPRTWSSGFVTGPPFVTVLQNATPTVPLPFPLPFASGGLANAPTVQGQSVDYLTNRTPYLIEWNLNVQREVAPGTILTVGYVGSRGVHLMTQHDLNPPKATIDAAGVYHFTGGANRISPNFSTLNNAVAYGNSWYHSLQANAVKRFSKNWQAQATYTWSHSIDLGSGTSGLETGGGGQANPYFAGYERGSSSFDVRHSFRANSVVVLPFKGNKLVEGWQLSGIFSMNSGLPINVNPGSDRALTANTAFATERPNLNPGFDANNIITGDPNHWFNTAAFSLQPSGTLGNFGRNVIRNPGLTNVDLALAKDTKIRKISEQFGLQFRAEIFNIFNHTNFAPLGTAVGSLSTLSAFTGTGAPNPTAGQMTSTMTSSRQIQLALKISF